MGLQTARFMTVYIMVSILICTALTSKMVIVETPFGKLRGKEVIAINNQHYFSFTGIPYAKPPVRQLRFSKPVPHPPQTGVFDATKESPHCLQPSGLMSMENAHSGQEDCLFLNIFMRKVHTSSGTSTTAAAAQSQFSLQDQHKTETIKPTEKKKVIVYIHGGGYVTGGAADYPPGTFVTSQDIIVVVINYRLGIFGFLSTEDENAPGNMGLWDQVLAMRWVKDNIASFGGDPDDITISGESAGGASVSILALSSAGTGLFSKAYMMSGAATSGFAMVRDALRAAEEVAQATGCTDDNPREGSRKLIACMRQLPADKLLKYSTSSIEKTKFTPRVDGDFLPLHPSELLKDDEYLESVGFFERKYLLGLVNNEVSIVDKRYEASRKSIMNSEDKTKEEKSSILSDFASKVRSFFIESRLLQKSPPRSVVEKITNWYDNNLLSVTELVADIYFLLPTYDFLYAVARSRTSDAFLFYLNYDPSFMRGSMKGTCHTIDLLFWFDIELGAWEKSLQYGMEKEMDQNDQLFKTIFSDMIGEFVKTGDPWNSLKDELPGGWPEFDVRGNYYLDLDSVLQ